MVRGFQRVISLLVNSFLVGASTFLSQEEHEKSICGEPEKHHSGYINGLFYVFYETRRVIRETTDVPVVLWLSGGPGCSGLIAMFVENGPCSVGQGSPTAELNTYSWTKSAHMLYVDQPRGTGFSPSRNSNSDWAESSAIEDLTIFLQGFFQQNPSYASNDLYIFGESYGGRYVPDLVHHIMTSDNSNNDQLKKNLRGIGIGNGLVSEKANCDTIGSFAQTTSKGQLANATQSLVDQCDEAVQACQAPSFGGVNDCSRTNVCTRLSGQIISAAHSLNMNHYDIRAPCYPDAFNLCYKFTPLFMFVNMASTMETLGMPGHSWAPCNQDVFSHVMNADWFEESEYKVAYVLNHGVRVLIYAGDYDLICNWMGQDKWTQEMVWDHQTEFRAQPLSAWKINGQEAGQKRSFGNLTMLRVYNAGHMVPHDQPEVALEMFSSFIHPN
ncbi:serine carboxypeptidase-like 48-like [Thraustotheca clavata]|uniref:Carboxypeptidase n=1 Tax=Thraustotheca clavata TaxID=74557 RepID=A0A1W0AB29_9STRA|nr:serine carboxypeptidase-like 48-like [Thraustotheca clavata]